MLSGGTFRLGELFESANGNFDLQKTHINGKGDYVITAGLANNGIMGKTDIDARVFDKNTITIDMFGAVFYRNFQYKMVTHARVFSLKAKFEITEKQGLFLANSFHFLSKKFGYDNMCSWTKIKDTNIQLPSKNNTPDFDFMDAFIAELQQANKQKLKSYLAQNGLLDCTLTDKERLALETYNNVEWGMFKLGDLFDVKTPKKRFDANKVTVLDKGGYPYVVRVSSNNGCKGFIDEDKNYLNEGNTISFGQDTATIYYQKDPYFTGDKIKVLKAKDNRFSHKNAQFFISAMSKTFSSFSWGSTSFSVNILEKQKLNLPMTKNNQIDFDFMDTLISAVHKLMVKNVVRYVEKV